MTVGGGFGAPGPVFNPGLVPAADDAEIADTETEVEEPSDADVAEQSDVAARLDDPEVAEAIEHLKPTSDGTPHD